MSEHPVPSCDHGAGCITCGDTAVEMEVLRVDRDRGLALCSDAGGAPTSIEIALVEPVGDGDRLLVHAGTAIAHAGGSA